MAMEASSVQFSIGRVIGSSFGVYARNFISFTILALLIGVISLVLGLTIAEDPAALAAGQINYMATGVGFLGLMVVNGLTQAAIIYGTFQDLRGQKAGLGDCIARGLTTVIPVIVGSILFSLAVGFASLLLLIPGIILALMWWVYIPVIVVEGKGITGSFGRSSELTSGRRWHILGLIVIVILISFAAQFVFGFVTVFAITLSGATDVTVIAAVIEYVATSLVTAFGAVLVAVGYYYLRAEKEGIDVNQIAAVFD